MINIINESLLVGLYSCIVFYGCRGNESIEILRKELDNALKDTKIIKQIENIPERNKKVKIYIEKVYDEALKTYLPTLTRDLVVDLQEYYDKFGHFIPPDKIYSIESVRLYKELYKIENFDKLTMLINDEIDAYIQDTSASKDSVKRERFLTLIDLKENMSKENCNSIEKFHDMLERIAKPLEGKISDEEMRLIEKTTDFVSILMDMYLTARIFREFRQIDGVYSGEPKNIIIYAGDFHSGNYSKMFEELGFTKIFSGKQTDKSNCLDLSVLNDLIFLR